MSRRRVGMVVAVTLAGLGLVAAPVVWVVHDWATDHSERMCDDGEVVVWHVENTSGTACAPEAGPLPRGYAFYPPGRVPVWNVPPEGYPVQEDSASDVYDVHPNAPSYPWKQELLTHYPETDCANATKSCLCLPGTVVATRGGADERLLAIRDAVVGQRCGSRTPSR